MSTRGLFVFNLDLLCQGKVEKYQLFDFKHEKVIFDYDISSGLIYLLSGTSCKQLHLPRTISKNEAEF